MVCRERQFDVPKGPLQSHFLEECRTQIDLRIIEIHPVSKALRVRIPNLPFLASRLYGQAARVNIALLDSFATKTARAKINANGSFSAHSSHPNL